MSHNSLGKNWQELKKLSKHSSSYQTSSWKRVIGIIFSLSTEDEIAEELMELEGVETLLDLLHHSFDPRICGILLNISNNERCREKIVEIGGIKEVCRFLKKKVDDSLSVEYSCGALLNLVQDDKSRDALVNYRNIYQNLCKALKNDLSKEAHTQIISLISNLIVEQVESIRGNEEVMVAVVSGLKSKHKTIVSYSLNCLWNICVDRDEEISRTLFEVNALSALGEAMTRLEGEEAGNCLVCMSMIIEHVSELTDKIEERILEIVSFLDCEDLNIATGAATSIWNISQNDVLGTCIPKETISTLSSLLKTFLSEKDVKSLEIVLSCLISLLTKEEEMVEYLVLDGNGLHQIYNILEKEVLLIDICKEDEKPVFLNCIELSILISCLCSEIKKGQMELFEIGIITELIDLITLKRSVSVKSKEYITACLFNVSNNHVVQKLILKMDAIQSIMDLAHHANKRLSSNSLSLLSNLAKNHMQN